MNRAIAVGVFRAPSLTPTAGQSYNFKIRLLSGGAIREDFAFEG